jgi:hypothetical protein
VAAYGPTELVPEAEQVLSPSGTAVEAHDVVPLIEPEKNDIL